MIAGTEVLRRRESDNSFKEKVPRTCCVIGLYISFSGVRRTVTIRVYAKGIECLCIEASEGGEKKMRYENDHDRKSTYTLWTQRIGLSLRGYHGSKCSHDHTIGRR